MVAAQAKTPGEIEAAFEKHAQQRTEALIIGPDTFFLQHRQQIATLAARYRVPMSYGHDVAHNFHLAATYVDRIFRGANVLFLADRVIE